MSPDAASSVPPPPTLDDWVAWVDRVGGTWVPAADLDAIGCPVTPPSNDDTKDQPC